MKKLRHCHPMYRMVYQQTPWLLCNKRLKQVTITLLSLLITTTSAEAYILTKWHFDPSTVDMGRKLGAAPPFGELGPHLTQCRRGQGLTCMPRFIMPLGTKVGLSPGHIVLDRDPAALPAERDTTAPLFWKWKSFKNLSTISQVLTEN